MKIAFNIVCLALLVSTVVLAFRRHDVGSLAVLLGGALLAGLIGNSDRIASINLSTKGLEAKTREVQEVIDKATATVQQLHQLALMMAGLQVDMLAGEGRLGPSGRYKDARKQELLQRLKKLGLTNDELAQVDDADRYWVMYDYAFGILRPMNGTTDSAKAAAHSKAFASNSPPTPDQCAELLKRFGIDDPETKELLADYRYYVETGKQRRPDVWSDRDHWLGR